LTDRAWTDRIVIEDGLDYAARQDFVTAASSIIEHARAQIEVDCSEITTVDDQTVGLLVWLTRNARRRSLPVVLDGASPILLAALDRAGVADRFAAGSGSPAAS
jgi:ABC-type transporter Mla MlaB component